MGWDQGRCMSEETLNLWWCKCGVSTKTGRQKGTLPLSAMPIRTLCISLCRSVSPLGAVRMRILPCRGVWGVFLACRVNVILLPRAAPQEYEESITSASETQT